MWTPCPSMHVTRPAPPIASPAFLRRGVREACTCRTPCGALWSRLLCRPRESARGQACLARPRSTPRWLKLPTLRTGSHRSPSRRTLRGCSSALLRHLGESAWSGLSFNGCQNDTTRVWSQGFMVLRVPRAGMTHSGPGSGAAISLGCGCQAVRVTKIISERRRVRRLPYEAALRWRVAGFYQIVLPAH